MNKNESNEEHSYYEDSDYARNYKPTRNRVISPKVKQKAFKRNKNRSYSEDGFDRKNSIPPKKVHDEKFYREKIEQ